MLIVRSTCFTLLADEVIESDASTGMWFVTQFCVYYKSLRNLMVKAHRRNLDTNN